MTARDTIPAETCPVCGRDVWPDGDLRPYGYERCWHRGGHECEGFAAGFRRGIDRATDPQAEADRRLGAKVRELGPEAFDHAADAIDDDGSIFHDLAWVPKLRAIAAALREEAGR